MPCLKMQEILKGPNIRPLITNNIKIQSWLVYF